MCTATFEYTAEKEDELSFKPGDILVNVNFKDDGWWEGELNGKKGWFPDNFVETVAVSASEPTGGGGGSGMNTDATYPVGTQFAKVTYDYTAQNPDELSLQVPSISARCLPLACFL